MDFANQFVELLVSGQNSMLTKFCVPAYKLFCVYAKWTDIKSKDIQLLFFVGQILSLTTCQNT